MKLSIIESSNNLSWVNRSGDSNSIMGANWEAQFNVGPHLYKLFITKEDPSSIWEVYFVLYRNGVGEHTLTGTGNAHAVLKNVVDGINQWISTVDPKSFLISAFEHKRVGLYKRILNHLKGSWSVEVHDDDELLVTKDDTMNESNNGISILGYQKFPASIKIQYPNGDTWIYYFHEYIWLQNIIKKFRKNTGKLAAEAKKLSYKQQKVT